MPYSPKKAPRAASRPRTWSSARAGLKLGVVAHGVRFLTVAVDIQAWGFDYLVRGWGVQGESWIVDQGRIAAHPVTGRPIDPSDLAEDWDLLLELFDRTYPLADGSRAGS
jgi:phage terminase large subunit GpA-like protein